MLITSFHSMLIFVQNLPSLILEIHDFWFTFHMFLLSVNVWHLNILRICTGMG